MGIQPVANILTDTECSCNYKKGSKVECHLPPKPDPPKTLKERSDQLITGKPKGPWCMDNEAWWETVVGRCCKCLDKQEKPEAKLHKCRAACMHKICSEDFGSLPRIAFRSSPRPGDAGR